jgi:hypothetical protein
VWGLVKSVVEEVEYPDEVLNVDIALDVSSSPNVEHATRLEENPSAQKLACWISSGVRVAFD